MNKSTRPFAGVRHERPSNRFLSVRVDDSDHAMLTARAQATGRSISAYVRDLIERDLHQIEPVLRREQQRVIIERASQVDIQAAADLRRVAGALVKALGRDDLRALHGAIRSALIEVRKIWKGNL